MMNKTLDFITKNNGKFAVVCATLYGAWLGMQVFATVQKPDLVNAAALALAFLLAVFYTVNAYFAIRSELMDELMARLSSKEKENDSNSIDA